MSYCINRWVRELMGGWSFSIIEWVHIWVPVSDRHLSPQCWSVSNTPWYSPVFTTNITNPFIKSSLPLTYKELIVWWVSTHTHIQRFLHLFTLFFFHVVSFTTTAFQLANTVFLCAPVITDTHVFVRVYVYECSAFRVCLLNLQCGCSSPVWVVRCVPIRVLLTHISYFHTSVTALFSRTGAVPKCFVGCVGPESNFANKIWTNLNPVSLISILSVLWYDNASYQCWCTLKPDWLTYRRPSSTYGSVSTEHIEFNLLFSTFF